MWLQSRTLLSFFFFNDTATTEIYTLSLHDALPIYSDSFRGSLMRAMVRCVPKRRLATWSSTRLSSSRSEEHTSELQSHLNLVCRLLLEKKKCSTRCIGTRSSLTNQRRVLRTAPQSF